MALKTLNKNFYKLYLYNWTVLLAVRRGRKSYMALISLRLRLQTSTRKAAAVQKLRGEKGYGESMWVHEYESGVCHSSASVTDIQKTEEEDYESRNEFHFQEYFISPVSFTTPPLCWGDEK